MQAQLSSAEILEQVWHARQALKEAGSAVAIRNVVFMGMGAPLDNLDEVLAGVPPTSEIISH